MVLSGSLRLAQGGGEAALQARGALRRDRALRRGAIEGAHSSLDREGSVLRRTHDGGAGLLDLGAERRFPGAVARRLLDALAVALNSGCVIGHEALLLLL